MVVVCEEHDSLKARGGRPGTPRGCAGSGSWKPCSPAGRAHPPAPPGQHSSTEKPGGSQDTAANSAVAETHSSNGDSRGKGRPRNSCCVNKGQFFQEDIKTQE